jgi:hypothetical protein
MHIGFIGLGNMAGAMAPNLLKAGHRLRVVDLSTVAMAHLVEAGASAAASSLDLARGDAQVIRGSGSSDGSRQADPPAGRARRHCPAALPRFSNEGHGGPDFSSIIKTYLRGKEA